MTNARDVASSAVIGAEEYSEVVAYESDNVGDDYSSYKLQAPDGDRYRLTVERIEG